MRNLRPLYRSILALLFVFVACKTHAPAPSTESESAIAHSPIRTTAALPPTTFQQQSYSGGSVFTLYPPFDYYSSPIAGGSAYTTIATLPSGLPLNATVDAWFNVTVRGLGANSAYQSQFSQLAIAGNIASVLTDLTGTLSGGVLATDYTQASMQSTGLPGASVKVTGSGTSWVVQCKPPAGVDVVCAIDGLQYTVQRARQPLAYVATASVSPTSAFVGTPVTVTGTGENLGTLTGATINSLPCTSVSSTDGTFTITTPIGLTSGSYPIVLSGSSTAFPTSYTIPGVTFVVTNPSVPTITGIDSFWAIAEGVTGVNRIVSGTGFSGAVTLTITWSNASTTAITTGSGDLTVLSSTSLQINNWPSAPQDGLASFTVTTAEGTSTAWANATAGDGKGVGVLPAGAVYVVDPAVGRTMSGSTITTIADRVTGKTQSGSTIGSLTAPTYAASGTLGRPEIQAASNGSSVATGLVMTLASNFTGPSAELIYVGQISGWRNFSQFAGIGNSGDTDYYVQGLTANTSNVSTVLRTSLAPGLASTNTNSTVPDLTTTPLTACIRVIATSPASCALRINGSEVDGTCTVGSLNANRADIGGGSGGSGNYPKSFSQTWGSNKISFLATLATPMTSAQVTRFSAALQAYFGTSVSP